MHPADLLASTLQRVSQHSGKLTYGTLPSANGLLMLRNKSIINGIRDAKTWVYLTWGLGGNGPTGQPLDAEEGRYNRVPGYMVDPRALPPRMKSAQKHDSLKHS